MGYSGTKQTLPVRRAQYNIYFIYNCIANWLSPFFYSQRNSSATIVVPLLRNSVSKRRKCANKRIPYVWQPQECGIYFSALTWSIMKLQRKNVKMIQTVKCLTVQSHCVMLDTRQECALPSFKSVFCRVCSFCFFFLSQFLQHYRVGTNSIHLNRLWLWADNYCFLTQ